MEANLSDYNQRAFDRFCGKIIEVNGCYEYQGALIYEGYGVFWYNGRHQYAHRIAWVFECGEIPNGLLVLHKCDNRRCVNVEHLFLGTYKDNTQDMIKKGRQVVVRGEDRSPIKEATIRALKQDLQNGLSRTEASRKYNINYANVKAIHRGISWRHV